MTLKKALLVGLVVVLVLVGLPLAMPGMGAPACPDCPPALPAGTCVLALVGATTLWVVMTSVALRPGTLRHRELLWVTLLDRPPQIG